MRATVYQHPNAPVSFDPPPPDPRDPPVDVRAAKRAHDAERIANGYPPDFEGNYTLPQLGHSDPIRAHVAPSDADWRRLERHEALQRLALEVGWQRLYTMVRNLAYIHGEEVK